MFPIGVTPIIGLKPWGAEDPEGPDTAMLYVVGALRSTIWESVGLDFFLGPLF
jgi:hypothetical protein